MARRLLILAGDTDAGKSFAAQKLLEYYAQMGLRVGALKPVETGVGPAGATDGQTLHESCCRLNPDFDADLSTVVPLTYSLAAAPAVTSGFAPFDWARVTAALHRIEACSDLVIIESAGGALSPLDDQSVCADMATRLDARPLLLLDDRLGSISRNTALLEALAHRGLSPLWCINRRPETANFDAITLPWLQRRYGKPLFFEQDLATIAHQLLEE